MGIFGPSGLSCLYLWELAPGHLCRAIALHHNRGTQRGWLFWDGFLQQVLV